MAGRFIYPPPFGEVGDYSNMLNFYIGTSVTVNWTSIPTSPSDTILWLFQDGDGLTCIGNGWNYANISCQPLLKGNRALSWDWNVQQPENYISTATVYYLVMQSTNGSGLFTGHYMNILPRNLAPASVSSLISSSTISSLTSSAIPGASSSTSPASTTPASSSTSASASDTSLSGSTKIAIGTAVGIGVPLILLLALIAFLLHKKSKKKSAQSSSQSIHQPLAYHNDTYRSSPNKNNIYGDHQPYKQPQEMADQQWHRPVAEIDSYR